MRATSAVLVLAGALGLVSFQEDQDAAEPAPDAPAAPDALDATADLEVVWSDDHPPLHVPRSEDLEYRVKAGVGGLVAPVGRVTMKSNVEPYRTSVLLIGSGGDGGEQESGHLQIKAWGDYQLYQLDATLDTHIHPVRWPFLVSNFTQTGSKNRRKETLLGWEGETPRARYRSDTTRGAPKGTRIWKEPKERELPVSALDMVAASYYAREMVREERLFMKFPVADKLDLWEVTLKRGKTGKIETGAGTFDALQIILQPAPYPGEVADEKVEEKAQQFRGLFGLHGSITFWVEQNTGVPVLISGDLPAGPITVSVSVVLERYSGTPEAFRPAG